MGKAGGNRIGKEPEDQEDTAGGRKCTTFRMVHGEQGDGAGRGNRE